MYACCPLCGKLCSATPGPQKWGTRERTYKVTTHNAPGCPECGGVVRFVHDDSKLVDAQAHYRCAHGHLVDEGDIVEGPPCSGHTREIR